MFLRAGRALPLIFFLLILLTSPLPISSQSAHKSADDCPEIQDGLDKAWAQAALAKCSGMGTWYGGGCVNAPRNCYKN